MHLKPLISKIITSLKWRPERVNTFTSMVISLMSQNNVQHHSLAKGLTTKLFKSKLERIRRFFVGQVIDDKAFAMALVMNTFKCIPKMDLILDRTNWKYGKSDINFLVLAARIGQVTFPLFWNLLPHQGCSDFEGRQELLNNFKNTFGLGCVSSLSADREFIGQDWLTYLVKQHIPFLSV